MLYDMFIKVTGLDDLHDLRTLVDFQSLIPLDPSRSIVTWDLFVEFAPPRKEYWCRRHIKQKSSRMRTWSTGIKSARRCQREEYSRSIETGCLQSLKR